MNLKKYFLLLSIFPLLFIFVLSFFMFWEFSKTNPNLEIPEKEKSAVVGEKSELTLEEINQQYDLILEALSQIDSLVVQSEKTQPEMTQNFELLKKIFLDPGADPVNRKTAGMGIAAHFWGVFNVKLAVESIFTGSVFSQFLDGNTYWDVYLALANFYEYLSQINPKGPKPFFRASDLFLDFSIINPNLDLETRETFVKKSYQLFLEGDRELKILEDLYSNYSQMQNAAKLYRIKGRILAKLEILGRPKTPSGEAWNEWLERAISIFEQLPESGIITEADLDFLHRPQRALRSRIDLAHLLVEIEGEKSYSEVRKILDPIFDPKNQKAAQYIESNFQIESRPDHNFHFHKRGLQILGNIEPRFRDLMLENGFEESFFTDFSLPIYPLPPQD